MKKGNELNSLPLRGAPVELKEGYPPRLIRPRCSKATKVRRLEIDRCGDMMRVFIGRDRKEV